MQYIKDGSRVIAIRKGTMFNKGDAGTLINQLGLDSENYYFISLDNGKSIGPSLDEYWTEDQ